VLDSGKISEGLPGGEFMGWQDNDGNPWGGQKPPDLKEAIEKIKKAIPLQDSIWREIWFGSDNSCGSADSLACIRDLFCCS